MYSNVPAKARIRPGQYARNCIRRNVRASAKLNDSSPPFLGLACKIMHSRRAVRSA
jgi:hypothetical protein